MSSRVATLLTVVVALLGLAAADPLQWMTHELRAHVHKAEAMGESPSLPAEPMLGGAECLDHDDDPATPDMAAGLYPCEGIDLLAYIPTEAFSGDTTLADANPLDTQEGTDMWGWTDPETGTEYVLMGKTNGVAFYDISDPTDPVHVASMDNTSAVQLLWHDIKVYEDHAFIVSESNFHGMQIVDLTRLRGLTGDGGPEMFLPDAIYPLTNGAHNLVINEESGFAYIVGGSNGLFVQDQCRSGLHMVDISIPTVPVFAGCYLQDGGPSPLVGSSPEVAGVRVTAAYVHDAQCVIYRGPDRDHDGREICINAAEDRVVIVDVTNKLLPTTIASFSYADASYTHQAWLTEDHRYLLVNDETDETGGIPRTRTIIFDLLDLDAPSEEMIHYHHSPSIDHNLYVADGAVYQSHYSAGLRVSDLDRVGEGVLEEVAYFDVHPEGDVAQFVGTWSNYPWFESGTIAISGYEGLWLVRLTDDALAEIAD